MSTRSGPRGANELDQLVAWLRPGDAVAVLEPLGPPRSQGLTGDALPRVDLTALEAHARAHLRAIDHVVTRPGSIVLLLPQAGANVVAIVERLAASWEDASGQRGAFAAKSLVVDSPDLSPVLSWLPDGASAPAEA